MITFKGNPIHLIGNLPKVGETAPDFVLKANDLSDKSLKDFPGKKIISVVPSLDTGVCSIQTQKFNEKAAQIGQVITVSVDLPFAQARWCGANVENAITLSDYYDRKFGQDYGLYIDELHLLSRAVFVLDADNKITYIEVLDEVGNEPNYDKAIEAFKAI